MSFVPVAEFTKKQMSNVKFDLPTLSMSYIAKEKVHDSFIFTSFKRRINKYLVVPEVAAEVARAGETPLWLVVPSNKTQHLMTLLPPNADGSVSYSVTLSVEHIGEAFGITSEATWAWLYIFEMPKPSTAVGKGNLIFTLTIPA